MNPFRVLCWFLGHRLAPCYARYCPHYWCERCERMVGAKSTAPAYGVGLVAHSNEAARVCW